jgi:hypothetical protein
MSRFEMLGAEPVKDKPKPSSMIPVAATIAGGALGMLLWSMFPRAGKKHPVLGLLDGMALGGNIARFMTGEISLRRAGENLGAHLVATAASLAMPEYPTVGYLSGAFGASLFFQKRDDSYLERLDEVVLGGQTQKLLPGKREV